MTVFGIIGAGNIGTALAQAAIRTGNQVVIANSRGPETLTELIAELGPQARAATAQEAAEAAEIAVVTIPLRNIEQVPAAPLAGKILIDTNNYYPQRDGQIAALDEESTTTAELVQAHFPGAKVVKAFNHIGAKHIAEHATAAGTPGRRALAIAGDDAEAKTAVAAFIDAAGFDVVDLGALPEGWRVQRDTPAYVVPLAAAELRAAAEAAKRYRER